MKRFITVIQKHLGITRSEAVAITFIASVLSIGSIGSRLWPTTSTHEHVTAERISQMLDSLESDRLNPEGGSPIPSETRAEPGRSQSTDSGSAPRPSPKTPRVVNLNSATTSDLESLPGIGPAMAQRIIEARTRRPFTCAEDLLNVKGIGEKKLAKLLPYVKVP
ncbi:MAG: helix-hairpin-helix domain-containing protein [Ignavibacteria bacterium]|nr:helix-hairpin-helix domain-containing protein [Ignavibacteria bacterium]MBK7185666.1 helix-hairpin-helix domain-containing protein [Ignavibacteria bacterium]MBK7577495.1 helix-hairpin-helix domain-containing protein [Ignavibacteria bacterium]MBK9183377.1 helix-hairpin-helix domain-containing protein [Ignavibacteria bacterium]MBP6509459.1 helix-hairpin-helix domain-containing protein [Candidatus Kapabacteria bacterium]